jgi:membrane associated rhomboid family serine protease
VTLPDGRMTNMIAVVTLSAFVLTAFGGLQDHAALVAGFIPARVDALAVPEGMDPFWVPVALTPLTATLVHGGWMHVGFNLLMLLFCGRQVEHVLGRWPTLLLYGVGAYVAAGAQWLVDPASGVPMVGASGAISALMGTYALLYGRQDVKAWGPISANVVRVLWLAAGWVALQALIGVAMQMGEDGMGQIAIAAHIGGFIAGLLLTRPLLKWRFGALSKRYGG